ncbi:hypothetical protein [Agaribacter flavus]|uniref:Uncharacterized protein n=1 Tax=Agaribacter flavus TaxID=1902781 RepID=A0ABV7FRU0_9ALTE
MRHFLQVLLCSVCLFSSFTTFAADKLLSLKNLERQRAHLIQDMLSTRHAPEAKQKRLIQGQRQLIDMERMVIRDERLSQQNEQLVRRAFSDFEMTFLVHASAEKNKQPMQHWLDSVGFSSQAILTAQPGFRK